MNTRSFRQIRAAVLKALETGNYQHEARSGKINEKNLLQVGMVTDGCVADAIKACPARNTTRSTHHYLPDVDIWTLKTTIVIDGISQFWYIKFFCLAKDQVWFISVHPSDSPEAAIDSNYKGARP